MLKINPADILLAEATDDDLSSLLNRVTAEIDHRRSGNVFNNKPTKAEWTLANHDCKIPAIKMVRARLGLGLKDAKDLVEFWVRENTPVDPAAW